ncbi:hypothetical protein C6B38_05670, partial [Spiroplasma sp. ChiS]
MNLDKKIFFSFGYINKIKKRYINKIKKINVNFINEIKKICNYSLLNLLQCSRQSCVYSTIDTNKTCLPNVLSCELVNYINSTFN